MHQVSDNNINHCSECHLVSKRSNIHYVMASILEGVGVGGIGRAWSLLMVILCHR